MLELGSCISDSLQTSEVMWSLSLARLWHFFYSASSSYTVLWQLKSVHLTCMLCIPLLLGFHFLYRLSKDKRPCIHQVFILSGILVRHRLACWKIWATIYSLVDAWPCMEINLLNLGKVWLAYLALPTLHGSCERQIE